MSLWLHAIAGGLEGIGANLTAQENEKRQLRGIKLRESYQFAREERSREFQSGERQKDRDLQTGIAGENREDRRLAAVTAEKNSERRHQELVADKKYARESDEAKHKERIEIERAKVAQAAEHFRSNQGRLTANAAAEVEKNRSALIAASKKLQRELEQEGYERDEARKQRYIKIYSELDLETDEMKPNMQRVAEAEGIFAQTGKDPWQNRVTADNIVESVKKRPNLSVDDVIDNLLAMNLWVPHDEQERARSMLGSDRPNPRGTDGLRLQPSHSPNVAAGYQRDMRPR